MVTLTTVGSGSDGNCHILQCGEEKLILDAGKPIKEVKIALGFNIRHIDGVLVTHRHTDHSQYTKDFKNMGIPVIKPYEENVPKMYKGTLGKFTFYTLPLYNKENNQWAHTNSDGSECKIYGYLICIEDAKLLYLTDYLWCPYTFKSMQLTDMLIEGHHELDDLDEEAPNFYHTVLGHPTLETTAEIVKINSTQSLKNVILCHCSANVTDCTRLVKTIQQSTFPNVHVNIARKGQVIIL